MSIGQEAIGHWDQLWAEMEEAIMPGRAAVPAYIAEQEDAR